MSMTQDPILSDKSKMMMPRLGFNCKLKIIKRPSYPKDYKTICKVLQKNEVRLAHFLVKRGCKINPPTTLQATTTPLHMAVEMGEQKLVKMLLRRNASLKVQDSEQMTALHIAFWMEKEPVIDILLYYNARYCPQVNPHDHRGISHLHIACARNVESCVEALLRAGADINKSTYELATPKSRDDHPGYTPLHVAIKYFQHTIVQTLLRHGADIDRTNAVGDTPLMEAAAVGNQTGLELLLRAGAKVNEKNINDDTALIMAVKNRSSQFADLFIHHGVYIDNYDRTGKTAIYWACYYGKMMDVQTLVQAGCKLYVKDVKGRTLMHAVAGSHMDGRDDREKVSNYQDLFKMLLHAGLNLNSRDYAGNTPLHIAAKRNNKNAIMVLLEFGAEVDLYNYDNLLPIGVYVNTYNIQPEDMVIHCFAAYISALRRSARRSIPTAMDPVLRQIEMYINSSFMRIIDERFEEEFDRMRNCHLNRYTTLYDLLFMTATDLVVHLNNEKLSRIINSDTFRANYPFFGYLMNNTYQKARSMAKLVGESKRAISFLYECRLPQPCCEAILRHLDNTDMVSVMKAVNVTESEDFF